MTAKGHPNEYIQCPVLFLANIAEKDLRVVRKRNVQEMAQLKTS
jgi:hypothetical protein